MKINTQCQFMNLLPGAVFRYLDNGYYYIVTREMFVNEVITNAMCIDGCLSSINIGDRIYIRPTEEVYYCGHLGLNWRPDEF